MAEMYECRHSEGDKHTGVVPPTQNTVTAVHTFALISSWNWSSCFCPMTRVLPNHRLSGWILVFGKSLDCRSCKS